MIKKVSILLVILGIIALFVDFTSHMAVGYTLIIVGAILFIAKMVKGKKSSVPMQ